MRINTTDDYEFRLDLYERAADTFEENTKTAGIDKACKHARRDQKNKEKALQWAIENLTLQEAKELVEILSTPYMQLEVSTDTGIYSE
jgi:3-keto-L-gulonate-6-phosphate decarboxylase